ncbi:PREDICTED: ubiquitin carboxyl-terminal hydrolase 36 isoform X2 [Dinoponera quadriceps]|nr:PREDICTED: ubiquitin carboxyl-terminal hydrolase 36 isoform X2 [Dinoponera quadriceps]
MECLTCAMIKTLQFSHLKSGSAIKPFYIYNKLKLICRTMVPGQQEDAHEFLRYLLEGMERAYLTRHKATKLDSYSKETTPINQIFGGYIRTEVKCLQCQHVSTTFQHFQDLLVDIRKANTLDEALSSYFSREQLDNNDYKCEACKRRVPATKQFTLERPPKVLCVQLKRFSVIGAKISKHIGFKQTIDMGRYLWREPGEAPKQLTYKLMSLVTHMGPSVNCGHYTAIAQVSSGQYYTFDDACVRPISLNNVLSTNAYIMIFEMSSSSQNQPTAKVNGTTPAKSVSTSLPSSTNKSLVLKASTSAGCSANGSLSELSSDNDNSANATLIGPQLPPQRSVESNLPTAQKCSTDTSQKQQTMQDKSQPRLVMHIKNGKVLNGNSLVPYDGSSEEEDACSFATMKNQTSNTVSRVNSTNSTNGVPKCSVAKDAPKLVANCKEAQKAKTNTNNIPTQTTVVQYTKSGSNNNSRVSLSKHQNGKVEINNQTERDQDTWHQSVRTKGIQEVKVPTKATSSSLKGWQVSKDTPSPATTGTPNGWSVTDNKEDLKSYQSTTTPSAAAVRDFNGTNRSDTVSHLHKMSYRGYGSPSVISWNGSRTQLERDVENDRREERKRHFNVDDEEIDRGRVKKVKDRRSYENRASMNYNPIQQYQNNKPWNRPVNGHRRYYNTSYGRSRHGSSYNRPQHYNRYHNHSPRVHWHSRERLNG